MWNDHGVRISGFDSAGAERIDYAGLLSRLIVFQDAPLIVSIRGETQQPPLFLFFDSKLIRGWDANMGGSLGHGDETFELVFENGVSLVVDPSQLSRAIWSADDPASATLSFVVGSIVVVMTRDSASAVGDLRLE